jgi:muconolactone delta-isomerase
MKVLALEQEIKGFTDSDMSPHLKAEAMRAWDLYQDGIIREMYFDKDHHTAVIILECESADAARAILSTLPLVKAGLITFNIIPLVPYPGFSRLFADKS